MSKRFGRLWERWKKIALAIGTFNGRVILAVFYFAVVTPFALLSRAFSDPLGREAAGEAPSFWQARQTRVKTLEDAKRQF